MGSKNSNPDVLTQKHYCSLPKLEERQGPGDSGLGVPHAGLGIYVDGNRRHYEFLGGHQSGWPGDCWRGLL